MILTSTWLKQLMYGVPPKVVRIWDKRNHRDWGNNISMVTNDCVMGWLEDKPKNGDLLHWPSTMGNTIVYQMSEVFYYIDPWDMWKAKITKLGLIEKGVV